MNCAATISIDFGGGFHSVGSRMNHRASLHEDHDVCVVWVDGSPWMRFDAQDIAARRLAMAQLLELRVATAQQIASAFASERRRSSGRQGRSASMVLAV